MGARRDAVRVLLRIALRNLTAAPVRTGILGAIILVGSLIVVVGSSLLDSIDRGMRTSVQGSLGGHAQVYAARSEGALELYGGLRGESLLEPIEDFAKVKEVLSKVPNVKQVVPMGIDQAMVATGTTFDVALERLREDVRRMEAGDASAERLRLYASHQAHVRRMVGLLAEDIQQARAIADLESREIKSRMDEFEALRRAGSEGFWREFDADRYGALEFLENRVAPVAMENSFTFIRYVGTDVEAFFRAFPLAEVAEGRAIPPGRRGVLIGKQFAEEWLKLKNARRLDQIKDLRDRRGKTIAKDEELQRWVRDNRRGIREILLQPDPVSADDVAARPRAAMAVGGAEAGRHVVRGDGIELEEDLADAAPVVADPALQLLVLRDRLPAPVAQVLDLIEPPRVLELQPLLGELLADEHSAAAGWDRPPLRNLREREGAEERLHVCADVADEREGVLHRDRRDAVLEELEGAVAVLLEVAPELLAAHAAQGVELVHAALDLAGLEVRDDARL